MIEFTLGNVYVKWLISPTNTTLSFSQIWLYFIHNNVPQLFVCLSCFQTDTLVPKNVPLKFIWSETTLYPESLYLPASIPLHSTIALNYCTLQRNSTTALYHSISKTMKCIQYIYNTYFFNFMHERKHTTPPRTNTTKYQYH